MLTSAGAKVVDFGISALVGERDAAPGRQPARHPRVPRAGAAAGGQVSPGHRRLRARLLLYRLLTGRLPWPAETTTEVLRAHLYADPEPLPPLPGLPPRWPTCACAAWPRARRTGRRRPRWRRG